MILSTLVIIANLFLLESLLSIDNATVLALMVKGLPENERPKALKYGIIGAFIMRGASLFLVSYLVKITLLKIAGGLYLLYLAIDFFTKKPDAPHQDDTAAPMASQGFLSRQIGQFWATVFLVELMDLSFSIDNVFAAVSLTNNIYLILTGVFFGIIAMRFVAQFFSSLLSKHPSLEHAAFIVIFLLGIKILVSGVFHYIPALGPAESFLSSQTADFIFSALTIGIFSYYLIRSESDQSKHIN